MAEYRDEQHRQDDGPQGSWWYVFPVIYVEDDDGKQERRPDLPDGTTGWCAWYGTVKGEELAAVRILEQLSVNNASPKRSVDDVLEAAGWTSFPYGRIKGK